MVCVSRSVMSHSLQPFGLQPTRPLCLWDFPGQEYWSGLPCPPPGDLPDLGIKPISPVSPALQGDSLPLSHWESPSRKFISTCCVQLLSRVWLFATPWTAAHQASLSITISQSLFRLMSIESVMPSNNFVLCPLLLLPSATFQYPTLFWIEKNNSILISQSKNMFMFRRVCIKKLKWGGNLLCLFSKGGKTW